MTATDPKPVFRYSVSGCAAHTRLVPLLPSDWVDVSPSFTKLGKETTEEPPQQEEEKAIPDFVWENAPRKDTKAYRDQLKAYSHLPNGTNTLDSKWVLARLLEDKEEKWDDTTFPLLAALESYCFKGPDGYQKFCEKMFSESAAKPENRNNDTATKLSFPDLLVNNGICQTEIPPVPSSLWVVKDAFANGAGGIWVVDKASAAKLESKNGNNNGPLYDDHRYVAQRYAWPPVLYGGRKCHVRVYGLITADGRAFVHRRAFLHVANDQFSYDYNNVCTDQSKKYDPFEDSVHITNCCANSDDDAKFAGEILADLEATEFAVDQETGQTIVPLGPFFASMKSSLAAFTHRAMPFLSGGKMNSGMEYLGMDFMLSYKDVDNTGQQQPVAYLLEINAPPSQDTATGLKHAEDLHDDVIRDILHLWVIPKVSGAEERPGGWRLAYTAPPEDEEEELILPSKATIINKIRWGMTERRISKEEEAAKDDPSPSPTSVQAIENCSSEPASRYVTSSLFQETDHQDSASKQIQEFARSKFPFFFHRTDSVACGATEESRDDHDCHIFLENAGGSQVPVHVINRLSESLRYRHRSVVGSKAKQGARTVFGQILGASPDEYSVFLGANATSLLSSLATRYVQLGLIQEKDEIVLSTENHLANVTPWLEAANLVGATVKWWAPTRSACETEPDHAISSRLEDLLTTNTRILAISHASNILGQIRDLSKIRKAADALTAGYAHLVVDGVAAAPHWYAAVSEHNVDWYVVSCHKLFGPHIGALCGNRQTAVKQTCRAAQIDQRNHDATYKLLEVGTVNYEGCSGVQGLGDYFADLATYARDNTPKQQTGMASQAGQTPFQSPQENPGYACEQCEEQRTFPFLTKDLVEEGYRRVRTSEEELTRALLTWLRSNEKVRIIEISEENLQCVARLPVVSFVHQSVSSSTVVEACSCNGVAARHGSFLSNEHLQQDFGVLGPEGVVRLSLAHYNTCDEIEAVRRVLETIPGWF